MITHSVSISTRLGTEKYNVFVIFLIFFNHRNELIQAIYDDDVDTFKTLLQNNQSTFEKSPLQMSMNFGSLNVSPL